MPEEAEVEEQRGALIYGIRIEEEFTYDGLKIEYFTEGRIEYKYYEGGKIVGNSYLWELDGSKKVTPYVDGKMHGESITYDPSGKFLKSLEYDMDKPIYKKEE